MNEIFFVWMEVFEKQMYRSCLKSIVRLYRGSFQTVETIDIIEVINKWAKLWWEYV